MDGVLVEAVEPAHGVGGDELARVSVGANRRNLVDRVALPGLADETLPVEEEGGIFVILTDGDFVEVVVGLGPVGGSPLLVQVRDGAVLLLQPGVELPLGGGAEIGLGIFVVELPADDVGIMAKVNRHLLGNVMSELTVFGICKGELLAVAVFGAAAVFIDAEGLRIFCREPCGRRGGGRAEDDNDVVFCGEGDGAIEPGKLVVAFGGLHGAPRKLADADEVDVGGFHAGEVGIPLRFGPLLGIPGGTEEEGRLVGIIGGLGAEVRGGAEGERGENGCNDGARTHVLFLRIGNYPVSGGAVRRAWSGRCLREKDSSGTINLAAHFCLDDGERGGSGEDLNGAVVEEGGVFGFGALEAGVPREPLRRGNAFGAIGFGDPVALLVAAGAPLVVLFDFIGKTGGGIAMGCDGEEIGRGGSGAGGVEELCVDGGGFFEVGGETGGHRSEVDEAGDGNDHALTARAEIQHAVLLQDAAAGNGVFVAEDAVVGGHQNDGGRDVLRVEVGGDAGGHFVFGDARLQGFEDTGGGFGDSCGEGAVAVDLGGEQGRAQSCEAGWIEAGAARVSAPISGPAIVWAMSSRSPLVQG